jgi:glycosyltransferase involved in cell wall biosynthesis
MALARPVAAYAHGALPEIVADGETGLLLPPFDSGLLAGAVARLLSDPGLARSLGLAGRRRVENQFSAGQMLTRIEAVLAEVLR